MPNSDYSELWNVKFNCNKFYCWAASFISCFLVSVIKVNKGGQTLNLSQMELEDMIIYSYVFLVYSSHNYMIILQKKY